MSKINVQNIEVNYQVIDEQDYICLTDMAKQKDGRIEIIIQNWMRNRMTIEFLGLWEKINNPNFNHIEFDVFRNKAGLNSFINAKDSSTKFIKNDNSCNYDCFLNYIGFDDEKNIVIYAMTHREGNTHGIPNYYK